MKEYAGNVLIIDVMYTPDCSMHAIDFTLYLEKKTTTVLDSLQAFLKSSCSSELFKLIKT